MKNRSFYFLLFCFLSSALFLTTLLPMEKKEDVLRSFQNDLNLFVYAVVDVIKDKASYEINFEFVEFLFKDKKFYKKFREKIAECANKFKGLREGKIKYLSLSMDNEREILDINRKIQKHYNKWGGRKKQDEKIKKKQECREKIKKEKEIKKIELEFEKANIEFAEAKSKFTMSQKKYEQALSDVKREGDEAKRKEESKRIEIEFEKANVEFADAKAKLAEAKKKYEQTLRDIKNKK